MADNKSDYLEDAVLNHFLRPGNSVTAPTSVELALFTVAPGDDGTGGTEVSGNGYARQAVTFGAPSGGTVQNSGIVAFPQASGGDWGTIVATGIYDNSGNLLYHGALASSKLVEDGDTISFVVGAITVSEV